METIGLIYIKIYLDALKANPNDPDNHNNIGYIYFKAGRYH